jgi:hypothetical protein
VSTDRDLWRRDIRADDVPAWPCPGCGFATLVMVKDSFLTVDDGSTSRDSGCPDFLPEFVTGRFVCLLKCTKVGCWESCSVSGNFTTGEAYDDQESWNYSSGRPISITPPPRMIQIPRACPEKIREQVVAAFALFWMDYAASLNRIRNAIELLLTEMGVKRHARNKKGGLSRLSLDSRIALLRAKKTIFSDLCDRLLAVKYLGNAGSHPGDVKMDDVFDGFDILERVLRDIYSRSDTLLSRMVRQINRRKGPR